MSWEIKNNILYIYEKNKAVKYRVNKLMDFGEWHIYQCYKFIFIEPWLGIESIYYANYITFKDEWSKYKLEGHNIFEFILSQKNMLLIKNNEIYMGEKLKDLLNSIIIMEKLI